MKKVLMLACLFVCLGFFGCGSSDDKVTGGTGLPTGWYVDWVSTPDSLFHVWHVGDTMTFVLVVYDENNNAVTTYDTSSTVWRIEQTGNVATLSDTTGPTTHVTAISTGTFKLYCDFKGSHPQQAFTVNP